MPGRSYRQNCALAHAADIIGDRWTLLLIRDLLIHPRRFRDLTASLHGAGTNLLSDRLRALESAGLIQAEALQSAGKAYALTAAGRALEPAVLALVHWGLRFANRNQDGFHHRDDWDLLALKSVFQPSRAARLEVSAQFRSDAFAGWFAIEDGHAHIGLGKRESVDLEFDGNVADVFTGSVSPVTRLSHGDKQLAERFVSAFALHA